MKSRRSPKSSTTRTRNDIEELDLTAVPTTDSAVLVKSNKREVFICFARNHLRPNGPIDLGLQDLQIADIEAMDACAHHTRKNPIFSQAALTFATIYFGTQHKQSSITNEGYAMHGAALKQLNNALSEPRCYSRDEVILSVVTLAMLECVVPTGPRNYLKHMLGLERLLELRGPASLMGCPRRTSELYKGVRQMILFASLCTRRRSILARSEWKTALRANCTSGELQEQDLYDVLADCTVLLAEGEQTMASIRTDFGNVNLEQHVLRHKALALLTRLRAWKARWDTDEANAYLEEDGELSSWDSSRPSGTNEYSSAFATVVRFASDSAARMLMLYNTTLIYVLQVLVVMPFGPEGSNANHDVFPQTETRRHGV